MAIVKGTWRFNDVLTKPNGEFEHSANFSFSGTIDGVEIYAECLGIKSLIFRDVLFFQYMVEVMSPTPDAELPMWMTVYGSESWEVADFQTITFTEEQEVSDEFYAWFTANANEVKTTATIKAGTYQFNDVLTAPSIDSSYQLDIAFSFPDMSYNEESHMVESTGELVTCNKIELAFDDELGFCVHYYSDTSWFILPLYAEYENFYWNVYAHGCREMNPECQNAEMFNGFGQIITFTEEQEVDDEFYDWFIANTTKIGTNYQFINFRGLTTFFNRLKTIFGYKATLDNSMAARRQYLLEIDYETDLAFNKDKLIDEEAASDV